MVNLSKFFNFFYLSKHNLYRNFSSLFSFLYIKIYLGVLVTVNLLIWFMANFIDSKIDEEQIALHYNVDFGINFYGDTRWIYVIPLLGFLIGLMNFVLFSLLSGHKDIRFISHILFVFALISNIILLIAISSIYLFNFK